MAIAQESNSNEWLVYYKRLVKGHFEVAEEFIRADHVILGAGALGSTKVLLRSKERGLNISTNVGTRFSTNGDIPAFHYNGDKETNSIGVKTEDLNGRHKKVAPGPCITTVMDLRKKGGKLVENFVIEDGTPPSSVDWVYRVGLTTAGMVSNKTCSLLSFTVKASGGRGGGEKRCDCLRQFVITSLKLKASFVQVINKVDRSLFFNTFYPQCPDYYKVCKMKLQKVSIFADFIQLVVAKMTKCKLASNR